MLGRLKNVTSPPYALGALQYSPLPSTQFRTLYAVGRDAQFQQSSTPPPNPLHTYLLELASVHQLKRGTHRSDQPAAPLGFHGRRFSSFCSSPTTTGPPLDDRNFLSPWRPRVVSSLPTPSLAIHVRSPSARAICNGGICKPTGSKWALPPLHDIRHASH